MGQSRINRGRARREELTQDAEERASARASRSNSEQIALLNSRLGLGVGAVRERERLAAKIEAKSRTSKKSTKSSDASGDVDEKSTTKSMRDEKGGRRGRGRPGSKRSTK